MKKLFVLCVFVFFLFTNCVTAQVFDRSKDEPQAIKDLNPNSEELTFYVHKEPWASPFNPHAVLKYWTGLHMQSVMTATGFPITAIVVGNPMLDWEVLSKNNVDVDEIALPSGEIAVLITFVFTIDGTHLLGYVVYDNITDPRAYRWENGKGYILIAGGRIV